MMNVRELIEELSRLPEHYPVLLRISEADLERMQSACFSAYGNEGTGYDMDFKVIGATRGNVDNVGGCAQLEIGDEV
jgi:hypothetical protein